MCRAIFGRRFGEFEIEEEEEYVISYKLRKKKSMLYFKTLLVDVENEYGYKSDGPLWLPCDVEFFCEALMEIEASQVVDDISFVGCSFPLSHKHSPVSNSSLSCRSSNLSCNVNYQVLVYIKL